MKAASKTYTLSTAQGASVTYTPVRTGWYTFKIRSASTPAANPKACVLAPHDIHGPADMNKLITFALAAGLSAPLVAHAQIVVDGTADAAYGAPLAVQDTPTEFGDSTAARTTPSDGGSELDAAYGVVRGGTLYLLFAGNVEANHNKVDVFVDSVPGQGQPTLLANNPAPKGNTPDGSDLQALSGLSFDAGFAPDFYITVSGGGTPYTLSASFATLPTAGKGTAVFVGSTTATGPQSTGTLAGGEANAPRVLTAIDNSNAAGVTNTSVSGAGAVKTGVEFAVPLSAIGSPTGPIKVCVFVNGSVGTFLSNQVLGGTGNVKPHANLGDPHAVNFAAIPSSQFFVVPNP